MISKELKIELKKIYHYSSKSGERIHENEEKILLSPQWSAIYARDVIKGRWKEAENVILKEKSSNAALIYAKDIIKGRWKEAESFILKNARDSSDYAIRILKRRWKEAEPYILQDPLSTFYYVREFFVSEKWEEAEYVIASDRVVSKMYSDFMGKDFLIRPKRVSERLG